MTIKEYLEAVKCAADEMRQARMAARDLSADQFEVAYDKAMEDYRDKVWLAAEELKKTIAAPSSARGIGGDAYRQGYVHGLEFKDAQQDYYFEVNLSRYLEGRGAGWVARKALEAEEAK